MARTAADQVRSEDLFTTALWGYSMDEVDAYVEDTARRMRRLAAEIQRLSIAENQLGAARIEISKLTSELAEARPLAGVGPRVQAILRMAEREAETLRRTAFEVLRKAYEEAREVRQKTEDDAYQAKRDYELALAHRRKHDKDELAAAALAEAAPSAEPEPEPEPRETVGMRELFAVASAKKRLPVGEAEKHTAKKRLPVGEAARKSIGEPEAAEAGSDREFAPDLEAERDVEPLPARVDARAAGPAKANGRAAGSAPVGVARGKAAAADATAVDAGPVEVTAQRDEPGIEAHAVPEVLEDEYPVIEEPVERFHNGSNKSRRKRARNQRANPPGSPDAADTLPAKRP
jgi:cell division septum initiation protein DivIVA